MFNRQIINADYETQSLQGGTVGDVQLVTGTAETDGGEKLPYKVVLKTQKKWERPGDPNSWRREYDLYMSDLESLFSDNLRWAKCYHGEINQDETQTQFWLEYIDGVSGDDLTIEMLEKASEELGRFQGEIYKRREVLNNIDCFAEVDAVMKYHAQWYKGTFICEFLCSDDSWTPNHLKKIIKNNFNTWDNKYTVEYNYLRLKEFDIPEHLKQMLLNIDENREIIYNKIKLLPVVLCHRDFWQTNIFYSDGKIRLIDWDTTGWGYLGEDIAQLISDDTKIEDIHEYYKKLIPAYYKNISKYIDISNIQNFYINELIIIQFGYRLVQKYMFTESNDEKNQVIERLQKIYELRDIKL